MPVYKGDPLSSGDCIEHEVFRGCLMRQAPPGVQRLFLGSHDLVEFSRKVNLDIHAMEDTVVGFASLREFWATPGVWKIYHDLPLPDFWNWNWEASSTLVPYLHFISNCGAYWNNDCKDANDLDLFIEVEQHGEKIHALLALCSTMVGCHYHYDRERTFYWRNRNPVVYEVDNFAELLQLIQQLYDRKIPSFPQVNIFPNPRLTVKNLALHTQHVTDAPPPWAGTSKHAQPLAENLASSSHHALAENLASSSHHALAENLASSSPQKPSRMYVPPHLRKADSRSKAEDKANHSMYTPPHLRPGARRPQITPAPQATPAPQSIPAPQFTSASQEILSIVDGFRYVNNCHLVEHISKEERAEIYMHVNMSALLLGAEFNRNLRYEWQRQVRLCRSVHCHPSTHALHSSVERSIAPDNSHNLNGIVVNASEKSIAIIKAIHNLVPKYFDIDWYDPYQGTGPCDHPKSFLWDPQRTNRKCHSCSGTKKSRALCLDCEMQVCSDCFNKIKPLRTKLRTLANWLLKREVIIISKED